MLRPRFTAPGQLKGQQAAAHGAEQVSVPGD